MLLSEGYIKVQQMLNQYTKNVLTEDQVCQDTGEYVDTQYR